MCHEICRQKQNKGCCRKYNKQVLVLLLVNVAKHLNLQSITSLMVFLAFVIDNSLWGMEASNKETNLSLVKSELSLYHQIVVNNDDMKSPLQWWKHHEKQFYIVAFLVR
jgi:hypothetical protein